VKTPAKWVVIALLLCIVASAAIAVASAAPGGKPPGTPKKVVKMVVTGSTMTPLAGAVENLAMDDGLRVYDRSGYMLGLLIAEANLMKAYGSEEAREQAHGTIKNLTSEFSADVWVHFNSTPETTTVTIRAGNKVRVLTFPTPRPGPETQARAAEVYNAATSMLG
jgi:hypothetical protein